MALSVKRMLEERGKAFDMRVIAGHRGLDNLITQSELHRPGLAFAGFLGVFTYDRVQIVGNTEIQYLESINSEERLATMKQVFSFPMPCIIITCNNKPTPEIVELCNQHNVPLIQSSHHTSHFNTMMNFWLEREFAPSEAVHAVLVDVFGEGVLMMGGSGVGKSECGLELIERGHRLVADDVVMLRRIGSNILMGASATTIQHHMEVRGLGIIDVELLFGIGAVREEKRVSLVVELVKWTDDFEVDRLGIDMETVSFLDVPVRRFRLPVESGRNISILIEVAALQHRILERGHNPADELNKRLIQQMTRK